MSEPRTVELNVEDAADGLRLDRWMSASVEGLSRNRLQALMNEGRVQGPDGPVTNAAKKVRAGDVYVLTVPLPTPAQPIAEDIALEVMFEDEHLIVINKQPGFVVHPAPGHASGTLVNALLHHCHGSLSGIGGVTRPGIVHRLDKDTSGIMVCAKSDPAHQGLVEQFQVHSIERAYQAVVWGMPSPKSGRLETQIGRDPKNRKRMANLRSGGKKAITDYKVTRPVGDVAALVDCHLFTGRTHQIRVQMSGIGNPLVGDVLYSSRLKSKLQRDPAIKEALGDFPYQALHAYKLGFVHPVSKRELTFENSLPPAIETLIQKLESI